MEDYHKISDNTMDNLLEQLEGILDTVGDADGAYEVEYHVRLLPTSKQLAITHSTRSLAF